MSRLCRGSRPQETTAQEPERRALAGQLFVLPSSPGPDSQPQSGAPSKEEHVTGVGLLPCIAMVWALGDGHLVMLTKGHLHETAGSSVAIPTSPAVLPFGFHWNVTNASTGIACLLLEAQKIEFSYGDSVLNLPNYTDTTQLNNEFGLPTISGTCTLTTAKLDVVWESEERAGQFDFMMEFVYHPLEGVWLAQKFTHSANGGRIYRYSGDGYFKSPLHSAYYCKDRSTVSRLGDGRASFIDIRVQAFPFANRFSPTRVECPLSEPKAKSNSKLSFVVGMSAGSIIIVAAIAVLLARCIKPLNFNFAEVSS